MEEETGELEEIENQDLESQFAFETDHLALKGNHDYCELLKYIVKLECQKVQALKDIEYLAEIKYKALEDPLSFIQKFKSGEVNFPSRQTIADLPHIDWSKYGIDILLETGDFKTEKQDSSETKVRGKKFTDHKPESFNQLWSCEEQKRLEELLEIYPEEPVEAQRYKKIAEALGTRTKVQVMCRIQKYFAKLTRAGLPIPGRGPKRVGRDKSKSIFYKKTTFFPQLQVPVKMDDPYENTESRDSNPSSETQSSADYVLISLKLAKDQRMLDEAVPIYQTNTMCVGCYKTGFLGARWTDNAGTDYCTDCFVKIMPTEKLVPVRQPV